MAVYTHVQTEDLEAFLKGYDIGQALSLKGIAEGVENSNYLLQTEKGHFILTLYEKRVDANDLPFFLGLMSHLSTRGIECPVPIADRQGNILSQLAGRPAAIISFLNGVCVMRPKRQHCAQVGEHLARMHLAGQDFTLSRPNALSLPGWRTLFEKTLDRCDEITKGLSALVSQELDTLEAEWPQGLTSGVIHADLFPDNVFFTQRQLSGLIDFYFACNDLLAYDLAICINAWCFESGGDFNATNARALTRAYQSVNPLPQADIDALPILCRGAAMRFLATRVYDWLNTVEGALVKPKNPLDYVARLRFHQGASSAASYGIE